MSSSAETPGREAIPPGPGGASFEPDPALVRRAAEQFGTPLYLYDERALRRTAEYVTASPNHAGLTVRYAMKAWPSRFVLQLFAKLGVEIDASSGFEAERALRAGITPAAIQLTGQELPKDLKGLISQGVLFNACSLHQLEQYAQAARGTAAADRGISIRVNPGLGSGHANRTNTGGPASSFGIWHEQLPEVLAAAKRNELRITGLHTHIGSGSDAEVWDHCAQLALDVAARIPDVRRVSLGGGYKVARMPGEKTTDLHAALLRAKTRFAAFERDHGRALHLEIEPGTFLVARTGAVVMRIIDRVSTGRDGYSFLKVDSGMTEILRPSIYGAQHPITLVPAAERPAGADGSYLVVGHCCESGDLLTPAPGDPEGLGLRTLADPQIGDFLVVGAAGAYCSGFSVKGYNSFPEAPEVMHAADGELTLLRKRQTLDQLLANEG